MSKETFQIILIVLGVPTTLGAFALGAGYLWSIAKKVPRQEKSDIIASSVGDIKFWKEQAEGKDIIIEKMRGEHIQKMEAMSTDFHKQLNKLSIEMGEIRGQFTAEREARIKAEDILKDKNPETKQFMEFMVTSATENAKSHKLIVDALQKILDLQEAETKKDLNITVTKTPTIA